MSRSMGGYGMSAKTRNSLLLMLVCVCMLAVIATPAMAWWGDWLGYPTSSSMGASGSTCGYTYWYCWAHFTNCAARNYWGRWQPGFGWNGRGWIHMDFLVPSSNALSNIRFRYLNSSFNDNGQYSEINECAYNCWMTPLDGYTGNVWDWNGGRLDMNENWSSSCANECGYSPSGFSVIHMYGDRYAYLNSWVTLGMYDSTDINDAHGLDEANLYLYPSVDTSHGDTICAGLWGGKHPAAYNSGDENNATTLNFGSIFGAQVNKDAYALAWVYSPGGAGPKFDIGSDDGEKCWVNGGLITNTGTITRGLVRDQDVTGGVGLPGGWSRVLMKVNQSSGGGGWEGTVSLRNGGDNRQCEMSVNFQGDRYGGYSIYNEQDSWYPTLTLSNFDGVSSPAAGAVVYTNNPTVAASGTAAGNFIPFWQTMEFQWGNGLSSAGENYNPTTNNTTAWSHSEASVTGHRRFHFFAVSKSGRTSGQASGAGGGWTWDASGHANYCDVYVDNVAPLAPSFSTVAVASPNQVNLGWAIPLDQGCGGVSNGSTEVATANYGGTNYYLRGDVGVRVRRNGVPACDWGSGTSLSDTGLASNTVYAYDIAARDNNGGGRGAWNNATDYVGTTSVCTLAEAPAGGVNVTAPASGTYTTAGWPGVASSNFGTGNGLVTKFKYKWGTSGSDSVGDADEDWTGGALNTLPTSDGTYYLYLRSVNAAGVGNGSTQFGPYTISNATPTVSIGAPSSTLITSGPITFEVTYGDAGAITLADTDVTLNTTGDASGNVTVSGEGSTTRTVTISDIAGDGTIGISIAAGTAGSGAPAAGPSDTFTVDNTAPTVGIGAPSASLTKGGPITFEITYGGADTVTLATGDVTLNKTGTANGTVGVSGSTVTISDISGDGTLGISIAANTASDTAGNGAPAAGPSDTFTVDNTAPTVSIGAPSASLTKGGPITFEVTYGGADTVTLATGDVTLNKTGTANGTVGVSGSTVTISDITGDGTLGISIAANTASDTAGNGAPAAGPSDTFTVDNTAPTASIGAPSASLTKGGPITFEVTYGGADTVTLATDDVTLNKAGTANGTVGVSGSTVTISDITGDGTLGISIAANTASDTAGNGALAAGPSDTFTVDNTAPTTTATPAGGVYNAAQNVTLTAPDSSAIYYTADGSEPSSASSTYSGAILISADTTLRFSAADAAGNTESPAKQEIYAILADNGSIADAKQATLGASVRLGDKALYLKSGGFGYIEEANRIAGMRVEGAISADEGQLICLTGTRGVSSDGEPCITVDRMTADGPGSVKPLGTSSRAFQYNLLDGLCVTTWGLVKVGSVSANSYVVTTGTTDTEITVITKAAPTVSGGDFVIVTGAVGFGATRVIYQK
jgi:hypothetical protein